jgi:hypothetical protein
MNNCTISFQVLKKGDEQTQHKSNECHASKIPNTKTVKYLLHGISGNILD